MVEWRKLVSVSDVQYGYPFESSLFSEDSSYVPLIRIRDVKSAKASSYYTGDILDDYIIKMGDILVGMDGEFNLGKWNDREGLLNQRVMKLSGKSGICLDGFLFHYMGPVFKQIERQTPGGSVKHLTAKIINNILIPVPSLSEQQRVVGILDTFTASIDNLKEQIAQRRKQYEYYRDQLLDLEGKEGVKMKTLGELSELVTKQTGFDYSSKIKPELIKKKEKGAIPFLQTRNFNGRNFDFETEYYVPYHIVNQFPKITLDKECLLLSIVGASIGNVGLFPGSPKCFLGGAICVLKFKMEILVPYIYEVMSSRYGQRLIQSKVKGAGQATITVDDIRHFIIPFPSIEEQQRIVSILDTFEASIQNLEAQLSQREKQYEYYRNKLLTFE